MSFPPPGRPRTAIGRAKKPAAPPPNPAFEGLFKTLSTSFHASSVFGMMPGTAGMAVGIFGWFVLGKLGLKSFPHFVVLATCFALATFICHKAEPYWGDSERSVISIDNACGAMFAGAPFVAGFHPQWKTYAAVVFSIYWFINLVRPPPMELLEDLPGGLKYTADDLLAAVLTLLLTWGLYDQVWVDLLGLR